MASASHAPEGPGVQILQQGQPLTEPAAVRAVSGGCKGVPVKHYASAFEEAMLEADIAAELEHAAHGSVAATTA